MNKTYVSIITLLGAFALFTGCSDSDDAVSPALQRSDITIQGTLDIRKGMNVPASAKLCAIWNVDANGDYSYLYGNGTFDLEQGTFSLTLDSPPSVALSSSPDGLPPVGIAWVVLADFPDTSPHVLEKGEVPSIYGAISNTAVVYIGGNPSAYSSHKSLHWLTAFHSGYSLGEGKGTNDIHDIFVPSAASSFVLTVSDNANDFRFPNWK